MAFARFDVKTLPGAQCEFVSFDIHLQNSPQDIKKLVYLLMVVANL
jgi:hypothetical protein